MKNPAFEAAAPSGDAELMEQLRSVNLSFCYEAADRIEALNIKVANLDRAWAGMNEEQAKQWRRAEAAEAALAERDAEIARLKADAERLDWLERHLPTTAAFGKAPSGTWQIFGEGCYLVGPADTVRSAIDAAMAAK